MSTLLLNKVPYVEVTLLPLQTLDSESLNYMYNTSINIKQPM